MVQWSIAGVRFETPGWHLSDATPTRMSWVGESGGAMTLTQDDVPAWTADHIDLDAERRKHRSLAAERRGGLVSVEVVEMASGALALEVLTKYPHGAGYSFEGRMLVDEGPVGYSVALTIRETETGVRESIVNALRMQLGEVDLMALMSAPADPVTGTRRIPGMQLDPYDAAYDDRATYSASDDPRLDGLLETHPLAVIRSSLQCVRATWECASGGRERGTRPSSLPHGTGPRTVLSDAFFQTLYAMVQERLADSLRDNSSRRRPN